MSGQGPQWWGMGRDLMEQSRSFARRWNDATRRSRPWAKFSLLEELGRSEETSHMHRTEIGQPAIFAMQVALAALWKSWGVEPSAIVGHSVGEIAAACVAGIFSVEEAARIVALRARFMEECGRGEGTMLAVGLAEDEARGLDRAARSHGDDFRIQWTTFDHAFGSAHFARGDGRRTRGARRVRATR